MLSKNKNYAIIIIVNEPLGKTLKEVIMYKAYRISKDCNLDLIGSYADPMDIPDDIYLGRINLTTYSNTWYRMDCQLLQRYIYAGYYPIKLKNLYIIEEND